LEPSCITSRLENPLWLLLPQTATPSSFARWHQVQRFDTLQMLAVKYGLDLPTLKRTNNLMTDHSIHSRTHLFVPGQCAAWQL
jgi:LysM repeat protein